MLRKRSYALRGQKVAIRDEFQRKPGVSLLAFIANNERIHQDDKAQTRQREERKKNRQEPDHSKRAADGPNTTANAGQTINQPTTNRKHDSQHKPKKTRKTPNNQPRQGPSTKPNEKTLEHVKKTAKKEYKKTKEKEIHTNKDQTNHKAEQVNNNRRVEQDGRTIKDS
ncbi:hypothetical protein F442_11011 [Phytophthora nicotianae P10297]|uniref:Uncharacterized protein n=1 Tax=Phytophthora nicotianae P10297 TaxID=1317064 RepID=W2Z430_PHYNI|nr:hypothetical protein F442_11011 [Phytophthora nicotianae P10297]